jgi:RNA polymerase sigma-70 factor, ECF subfamily
MYQNPRRLRRPEERVGTFTNVALPPPASDSEDINVVRLIRARNESACRELYDRYYPAMLRVAVAFVRTRAEAEEVIQDTWLAVLTSIDAFQFRSSFKTWVFRILVNRARSRGAREARSITFSDMPLLEPEGRADSPERDALDRELVQMLEAAVAELPETQRIVITLRDIEGWAAEDVCAALELTPANQRVLLHRARMFVRGRLTPYLRSGSVSAAVKAG